MQSMTATAAGLAGTRRSRSHRDWSRCDARVWTGATNQVLEYGEQLVPVGTPLPGDSVVIAVSANPPTLSANATVRALVIAPGAPLTVKWGDTLPDNGALDASGGVLGTGAVVLGGSGDGHGHRERRVERDWPVLAHRN